VVDEAYCAFTDNSFLNALAHYDNVVVMRTLSKMGLAGLRLGMLIGPSTWLKQLNKIRLPYNVNALTQLTAEFALSHYESLTKQTHKIRESREQLFIELQVTPGIIPFPSDANFILFKTPQGQSERIFAALKKEGVLIKCLHGSHPALEDCLRVTVGLAEENRRFLEVLKGIMAQG